MNSVETLNEVAEQTAVCTKCELQFSRKVAVPGEGPVDAEIFFIGEGPGFHENEQGRPFVGAAGQFLEQLLASIHLKREQVFITNVVKCRPPGNRDPQAEELAACSDYLERQILAINPKVIVTLGRYSMARFLPNAKISEIHGQAVRVHGGPTSAFAAQHCRGRFPAFARMDGKSGYDIRNFPGAHSRRIPKSRTIEFILEV